MRRTTYRLSRIQWRDRIAAHGAAAIDAVSPWVADPELGAFAVRVIEATAKFEDRDEAIAALASVHRVDRAVSDAAQEALAANLPGLAARL